MLADEVMSGLGHTTLRNGDRNQIRLLTDGVIKDEEQ